MKNKDIRDAMKTAGIKQWQLADAIGISTYTFSVWLRHELSGERLERTQAALNRLISEGV